jgi:hypothetical protein
MATASGFPLPLRNALAHLVLAALDEPDADRALAWLAASDADTAPDDVRERLRVLHLIEADGTLVDVHRPHLERVRRHAAHARRAVAAFHARPAVGAPDRVAAAVERAIALWNERLFFEVHEVLEAEWVRATGAERQALQGVIQIAVALHHHAHGNARGARTLMREGRERLAATGGSLPALDVDRLLADTGSWDAPPDAAVLDDPPRLRRRTG